MKTLVFQATECGRLLEDGTLVCGASNAKAKDNHHTLMFMRATRRNDPDDDGPYFELDDQSWGGCHLVAKCLVGKSRLAITLRRTKKNPIPHQQIMVDLTGCPPKDIRAFFTGLGRVYHDQPEILVREAKGTAGSPSKPGKPAGG